MPDNNSTEYVHVNIKKIKGYPIARDSIVKAEKQGKFYAEVTHMDRRIRPGVKKISKTQYKVLKTGEIRLYNFTEKKERDSLQKTFSYLRALIRTNFEGGSKSQILLTLTFSDRNISTEKLYQDFKHFIERLRKHFPSHNLEYITVAEPQNDGTWHMHTMIKTTNQPTLYVKQDVLEKLWGNGITYVERFKSDDVGSYYVSYFTDLCDEADHNTDNEFNTEINIESSSFSKKAKMIKHKHEKGSRLKFYPKNFKFFRCSKGIDRPTAEDIEYQNILDEYGSPVFTKAFEMRLTEIDGSERIINRFQKTTHKRKVSGVG